MKYRNLILPVGTLMLWGCNSATKVDIHPVPQQIEWGEKSFSRPAAINIIGAETADADAVALLRNAFSIGDGMKLTIGERGDETVANYEDKIPDHPQGYYLQASPDGVIIAGNDEIGTYYGVQTFLSVVSDSDVLSVEISDWPETPNRGVVEGFYGNAWSFEDRISQFDFYGQNKLDTYIYGPKDDPYHREKWREFYPEEDAERLKILNEEAKHRKVKFIWGIHPAGDHSWKEDDNIATIRKFEQMYSLGLRNFAVFFDDVFGIHADGKKHAEYMEYIMENFVRKHSDIETLMMCPSLYNKKWEPRFQPTYLEDIAVIDPFVQIMWTGNSVVDMIDVEDMDWVNPRIGRKAFIWLNYPVTDYCIDHLLMGPFTGNEVEATNMVSGFTANPMEYAEASKVSLLGTADFLWNPQAYDPDAAWEVALKTLVPDHTDAFRTFCLYNVDLGPNAHKLRRLNESPDFKALIERYESDLYSGYSAEGAEAFAKEFNKIKDASTELLEAADGNRLLSEIKPWIVAGELLGKRGAVAIDMYNALMHNNDEAFIDSYIKYKDLTDQANAITSRDFEGTIKSAHPRVGTLFAEPFIRKGVAQMIDTYKASRDYRLEIFPSLLLDNVTYKIKVGDCFLGNPDAGQSAPVLQAAEDDVNPDRQIWRFDYDPETDGYSIINANDGRYLNDFCEFGTEPFDVNLHTFDIQARDNGFIIINRSNGYLVYWEAKGNKISRIYEPDTQTVFQLIPVK